MIKVSFIIPVYCAAPFIGRCLDSIFALGIPEKEIEIICVDDCSPDNTVEVISAIAAKHPSVQLLRHEVNKRQGGGSNTAIRFAHGEYAVFMDQDDEMLQYDLLGLIEYMRQNELELLLGRVLCDDGKGHRTYWGKQETESAIMTGPEFFIDELINKVEFGTVWMGIYKTELLKRTQPFVENMIYEDTDWCFKCTYNAKRVQFKPIDMYLYYNNPTSSSHNVNAQKLEWKVRLSMRVYEWAQSVTEEKEAVQISAEDFYTWNLRGLGVLYRFSLSERRKFFAAFTPEEYKVFQSWPVRYKQMYALKFPRLAQFLLFIFAPCLLLISNIKHSRV